MYGAVYASTGTPVEALLDVARDFSPRVEICARDVGGHAPTENAMLTGVVLDLDGLARLFGTAQSIGDALQRTAAERGLQVRVAIAGTRTAARLLAIVGSGSSGSRRPSGLREAVGSRQWAVGNASGRLSDVIVVEPGTEAAALAPLPIELLASVAADLPALDAETAQGHLATLRRWGLRTLGDFARLPADAVAARLGRTGVQWQQLAAGHDPRPLIPWVPDERFEQALDLEWPIEGLEPLSFVLGRLMEPLAAHLERRGRAAAVLRVRLHLVTRDVHERALQLPAPMRDARALRTLALLDLESHPPPAAIDRVVVAVDPTPGRVVQYSLLTRPLPSPEQLSTLMARLSALIGEDRCGSPADVDAWQPGAFAITPFAPESAVGSGPVRPVEMNGAARHPAVALRRFRFAVPARVRVDDGTPSRVATDRRGFGGGRVERCAGPWRTSGGWWGEAAAGQGRHRTWDRDEWDVALSDGATYRVFHDRTTDRWFLEGVYD